MTTLRVAAGLATGPSQGERSDLVRWSAAQRREIDLYVYYQDKKKARQG